jgi:hypothetical protein
VKMNVAKSPAFPAPVAGRWSKRAAFLRAATLAAIAALGFCPMCSGGFVILLLYLTSITHIAVNRPNRKPMQPHATSSDQRKEILLRGVALKILQHT